MPYVRTKYSQTIKAELGKFLILAALVTSIIFFLFFKSFRATIISIFTVLIGVMWTLGIVGLLQYELTHVKQNIRSLGWSLIRTIWDKNHKLDRECEAYANQLLYVEDDMYEVLKTRFVNHMYSKHELGMSKNYIRRRFEKHVIFEVGRKT